MQRVGGDRPTRRTVLRATGTLAGIGLLGTGTVAGEVPGIASPGRPGGSPPPGPPVLHAEPVTAPPFENGEGWDADPLLVSGAHAYESGEFLYQDWVFDDYGANTTDGVDPPGQQPSSTSFGAMTGDIVYPTDRETYRANAADLLEFRCRPTGSGVTYRITVNTMPEDGSKRGLAAIAIGIDTGRGEPSTEWGFGLGDLGAPVDTVLLVWDGGARLDGPGDGTASPTVAVDRQRNQLEVDIGLDPGGETWRHYCVTGLFTGDSDDPGFKQVRDDPTETHPGGARGQNPPPVFNVGFRLYDQEPIGAPNLNRNTSRRDLEEGTTLGSRGVGFGHWRDHAQAMALAERDLSPFHADIDFGRLRDDVTDRSVPQTGLINRLYSSRRDFGGEGVAERSGDSGGHDDLLQGRVQPYSVYVPESYDGSATPVHLHMHSLAASYNQYGVFMPDFLRQVGERNDTIVFTPEARGPGEWYHDAGEYAVFEAWNDLRQHYRIDWDRVTLGGYSMGGFGTYKLGAQYPDLFARAFAIVGPPDEDIFGGPTGGRIESPQNTLDIVDNIRHVPILMWNGTNDELVPLPGPVNYERRLRDLGYRHELDIFPGYDHFTFGLRDRWGPGKDFLEGATVERAPAHVTYRRTPAMDSGELDLVHDGAYWVDGIGVRDTAESGLVDVRSLAAGEAEPTAVDFRGPGLDPDPHIKRGTRWERPTVAPAPENALEVTLEGVSTVTLYVEEAAIEPTRDLRVHITSDGPAAVVLKASCGGESTRETVRIDGAGTTEKTVLICGR